MKLTLKEIAALVEGELIGDPNTTIIGISGLKEAQKGDITFLANPKYSPLLRTTCASAVITDASVANCAKPLVKVQNPSLAFSKIASAFVSQRTGHPKGISKHALISEGAKLGKNVSVGAYAIIEDGAQIGDDTIIYGGCFIGCDAKIGRQCLIYPLVCVRERIEVGDRVIIHSGAVIGSDGFGFAFVKGTQEKIPQVGTVVIEDDVEIGANVTIDRARFDKTVIGKGTKIDNLVQIAHNVIVGENCTIVAQAGISGSTTLGKNVILAGQAGLVGHIHIGDGATVGAQGGVTKSVPANTFVSGYPARPHDSAMRINACLQRLPDLYKKIKKLEEKIIKLESKLAKSKIIKNGKSKND